MLSAARVYVPRVLNDCDHVSSQLWIQVQESAFPNVVFLAHILFL